jgi:hypothetical protein
VTQWTLDNAADRGKRVHKATEALDKYGDVDCDSDIVPQVKAYVQFRKERKPEYGMIERPMHHPALMYAGTIDREGMIDGRKCLIDLKCQEQIKKQLVKAQLNGYRLMYEAVNGDGEIDRLYCLQLKQDGTYKLHEIEKDDSEFMACYTLHKAMEKKPRKKKGDTVVNE